VTELDALILAGLNFAYAAIILAMVALGLAVIFGLLGVMNMAHGEFVMLGAYTAYAVQMAGWPFWTAIPVALVVCSAVGLAIEWSLVRHLYRRPFDTLLATWGLSILMRETIEIVMGRDFKSVDQVAPGTLSVLGQDYPTYRLLLMVLICTAFVVLYIWYRRSNTGVQIKAMVANPVLAASLGINTARLARGAFVFGVCTAALAGIALAPLVRVEPYMGIDYLLSSFFVLVIGGLGSLTGLLAGSSLIAGTDVWVSELLGSTQGYIAVLVISILFLWLKPGGLFVRR